MTTELENAELILSKRPGADVSSEDFSLVRSPVGKPGPGQALIRVDWLSMDTYLYQRTNSSVFGPALPIGTRIPGRGIGTVMAGELPAGTLVSGELGWQKYAIVDVSAVTPLERSSVPDTWHLSVLGAPGLTAWLGLNKLLQPSAGQTLLISGAAGTVGSIAGQLATQLGLNVVGIAGGPEKCQWLKAHGFQSAIDRKSVTDWKLAIATAAPNGIDLYFDNAGGPILEAAIRNMNQRGRVLVCGHSSEYTMPAARLTGADLLYKGLTMYGFRLLDHVAHFKEARGTLAALAAQGKLYVEETIHAGLNAAPAAMDAMLKGQGLGRHLVKVHEA